MRPSTLFFDCRMSGKLTRKAGLEVCGQLLCQVFDGKRNPPSRQSLTVRECNIGLFSLYCLYTGCFHALSKRFAHVSMERQTNIHTHMHTNIHTYIHTYVHTHKHTFCKTISENQVCAHSWPMVSCRPTPGLTIHSEWKYYKQLTAAIIRLIIISTVSCMTSTISTPTTIGAIAVFIKSSSSSS